MSKVYLVSLGCDKNRVDGEVMIGTLRLAGYEVVNNPEESAAIIINTCGFISDAVKESLDMVFELAAYKKEGKCRALIIVGCMAQRYQDEIKETIPEADAFIGVGEYEKIAEKVSGLIGPPHADFEADKTASFDRSSMLIAARRDSHIPHIAYVKISEGCDNHCTYCTIPKIRGPYKSRSAEEILNECQQLVESGAKELVLVAQDTALYENLPELLRQMAAKSGAQWIRLMYAYPEHITPELIAAIAETPQICKYIDMPIQHSETEILSRMGRKGTTENLNTLIRTLREKIPSITIRTTLMVGFPGETPEQFQALYDFAKQTKFDRLGAFPYSQEEGTPAAEMPNQIPAKTKQSRLNRLMKLQQKIHFTNQRKYVNQTLQVIIDSRQNNTYTGRTQHDAYESDTVVIFTSHEALAIGEICQVKITDTQDYDLIGVLT
jgi:ribosomal protein S12 methylthiotransferase